MSRLGINSKCAIVNYDKMFLILIIAILFHLFLLSLYACYKNKNNYFARKVKKLFKLFTFALYLRFLMLSYMLLLLSCENELYNMELSSNKHKYSFGITCFITLCLVFIWVLSFLYARKAKSDDFDAEQSYFSELMVDARLTKCGKLLNFILLSRIVLSVTWIIMSQELDKYVRICVYICIQLFFLILTPIVKPYEQKRDNITQFVNDWFYLFACSWLLFFNVQSDWSDASTSTYMMIIAINGLFLFIMGQYVL